MTFKYWYDSHNAATQKIMMARLRKASGYSYMQIWSRLNGFIKIKPLEMKAFDTVAGQPLTYNEQWPDFSKKTFQQFINS